MLGREPYAKHCIFIQAWRAANVACVWDQELVQAARTVKYVGHLVGGVVLIGGPAQALSTLTHAWSRSLLAAPPGYVLSMLGEYMSTLPFPPSVVFHTLFTGEYNTVLLHYKYTDIGNPQYNISNWSYKLHKALK